MTQKVSLFQALISSEQRQHDDLVQLDFFDSYANLTIKTSFMLKWINSAGSGCASAKFFFKVDDDAFVNPKVLWENLEHALLHTATTKSFINYLPPQAEEEEEIENEDDLIRSRASESIDYLFMGHAQKAVPIRDPSSKWYLPTRFYPLNIFPLFTSGCGYVVSTSVAPVLYQCALKTPYMNLEDVFISGLCAGTQLGLKLTHNPTFHFRKPLVCC